ncbi:YozE family protein [Aeribacillus pallidus]|uniref:YozE family protein n=1 Tax=Aeribacillus pallidus TaxID=33936 RepID=UPI003D1B5E68
MRKSFYHFLMKFRDSNPTDELAVFANHVYKDHSFPKQSSSYDEVSRYLELNGDYLPSMTVFDQAWEIYVADEIKIALN